MNRDTMLAEQQAADADATAAAAAAATGALYSSGPRAFVDQYADRNSPCYFHILRYCRSPKNESDSGN